MAMVLWQPEGIAGAWQGMASTGLEAVASGAGHAEMPHSHGTVRSHPPAQATSATAIVLEDISGCRLMKAVCPASWVPTGPARPRASMSLTGRYRPDSGRSPLRRGPVITGATPRVAGGAHGHLALVPGHEPLQRLHRARQCADRFAAGARPWLRCVARSSQQDSVDAEQEAAHCSHARRPLAGRERVPRGQRACPTGIGARSKSGCRAGRRAHACCFSMSPRPVWARRQRHSLAELISELKRSLTMAVYRARHEVPVWVGRPPFSVDSLGAGHRPRNAHEELRRDPWVRRWSISGTLEA